MYTQDELVLLLEELIAYPAETQWIEFKSNLRENDRIGKYISGLANSACFCGREHGYVVWGVDNDTHEVKGTSFDPDTQCEGNQLLRMWLATMLAPKAYDDAFYMQRVLEFICAKRRVSRQQINHLLMRHLSGVLDEKQKRYKIGNLLSLKLKKRLGWVDSEGNTSGSFWFITEAGQKACRQGNPSCKKLCKKL